VVKNEPERRGKHLKLHVYCIDPIDFWDGWLRPHEAFAPRTGHVSDVETRRFDAARWTPAWDLAQNGGRKIRWDGDIREGPYVAPLPGPDSGESHFMIAWKQDNNGAAFVASPFRLAWLENDCLECVVVDEAVEA
jgi:hypothetical protein